MASGTTLLITTLAIFVGAIMIYYLSYLFFGSPIATEYVLRSSVDGSHGPVRKVIPASKMNKLANSSDYSFSMWFYINDFQTGFGQPKVLMQRGEGGINANPLIYLEDDTNTLCVGMTYHTPKGAAITTKCKIPDVPVQRWVHLAVNVLSNGVNVYMNGRLFRSCSVPPGEGPVVNASNYPLVILPSVFGGKVSAVLFRNKTMSASEINAIYHAGPNASSSGILTSIFGIREIQFVFSETGSPRDSTYSLVF